LPATDRIRAGLPDAWRLSAISVAMPNGAIDLIEVVAAGLEPTRAIAGSVADHMGLPQSVRDRRASCQVKSARCILG
jgi:hypothetical protein